MWLTDLKLVLSDRVIERGSIRLEAGVIAEIIEGKPSRTNSSTALDGRGLTAIPGIVDIHGDMLERELEPRPGTMFAAKLAVLELDKRLAASGITTAFAAVALSDGPGLRSEARAKELIETIHELRPQLGIDMLVHARFEVSTAISAPFLKKLLERDLVQMVSLMDHTPGQGQFRDLETYVNYMVKWLGTDREQAENTVKARLQESQSAPVAWNVGHEISKLCLERGVALASHDDDTSTKVNMMEGFGATISEFPVTLEAAQAAKTKKMFVAMGAPNALRGASHSGNLSALEGIRAGVVDVLAADYYPAALLQSAYKIARENILPLEHAVSLITGNAAQSANLSDRGRLEPGLRADLVLIEETEHPRVRATFRQGRAVYSDGVVGIPNFSEVLVGAD
jgi:alpha-D-ribose 1-methylphosphonate 5-triphosphate diphosphatase